MRKQVNTGSLIRLEFVWFVCILLFFTSGCGAFSRLELSKHSTAVGSDAGNSASSPYELQESKFRVVNELRALRDEDRIIANEWLRTLEGCVGGDLQQSNSGSLGSSASVDSLQGSSGQSNQIGPASFGDLLLQGWKAFAENRNNDAVKFLQEGLEWRHESVAEQHCSVIARELVARLALFRGDTDQLKIHLRELVNAGAESRQFAVPTHARRFEPENLLLTLLQTGPTASDGAQNVPAGHAEADRVAGSALAQVRGAEAACRQEQSSRQQPAEEVDAVVVLGFQLDSKNPNELPPRLQARVQRALRLLRDNPSSIAILTGGGASAGITEAAAMGKALVESGVDPQRIVFEVMARDTLQNAEFTFSEVVEVVLGSASGRVSKPTRVAVVTDELHLDRAFPLFPAVARVMLARLDHDTVTRSQLEALEQLEWVPVCALSQPQSALASTAVPDQQMDGVLPVGLARDLARAHGFWLKPGLFR